DEGDRGRVPDRPQAPAQGRHAGARGEVQDESGARLPREAARRDSRARVEPEAARGNTGPRVRGHDGDLNGTKGVAMRYTTLIAALALTGCATTNYELAVMPRDSGT